MTLDAFAEVLPKWSLFDITGPRRGYQSTFRMLLDTYSQKVLVIPAVGINANGREVKGLLVRRLWIGHGRHLGRRQEP